MKKSLSLGLIALALAFSQLSFAKEPCKCWIDVKTGKRVGSIPFLEGGRLPQYRQGGTAFDPETKRNFAMEPGGCWIDVKTGKRVGSIPFLEGGRLPQYRQGGTAFDPETKRNFALVPCPPPGTAQPAPTPSTTDKVTDVLKTIGSSVSIDIGGGGYSSGHKERHHGEDRHRTADKVSTDKTKTHKTSPTITGKTVTAACKCHPCTCAPCKCH